MMIGIKRLMKLDVFSMMIGTPANLHVFFNDDDQNRVDGYTGENVYFM